MPESISSKPLSYEDRIRSIFATENFRMQGSVLKTDSKRKNVHSSRFKSEQRKKNEQRKIKTGRLWLLRILNNWTCGTGQPSMWSIFEKVP
ncbi:Ankyrin repeat domain-containing protein 31 [Lemmus lemmus]